MDNIAYCCTIDIKFRSKIEKNNLLVNRRVSIVNVDLFVTKFNNMLFGTFDKDKR